MAVKDILEVTSMIKSAFPALGDNFITMLIGMMVKDGFTPQRAKDAVEDVVRTCEYPQPQMARFLSYDKKERVYTYHEMLAFISANPGTTTNHFRHIETLKRWTLK